VNGGAGFRQVERHASPVEQAGLAQHQSFFDQPVDQHRHAGQRHADEFRRVGERTARVATDEGQRAKLWHRQFMQSFHAHLRTERLYNCRRRLKQGTGASMG
jgi:hypothetical protein